ncbi:hypothetical protein PENNAL_c0007G01520 [Penicillium nalgiovense]|uniref:Uncharacterized protein n=1 Tax=Penicillium nalgiovense TaxID=60175 RepID=A0A1V6YYB1_PENNA|nr:hypothetical protein PENNAL_c0007G01520 [Penicillium nalgiovense]
MSGISKYVSQIIADPRNINGRVLAYTEVLSMNEIWDVMARASEEQLHDIIAQCRKRLEASSLSLSDPSNIIDTANFNMGQYRISWCICGDNTPEYGDYLGDDAKLERPAASPAMIGSKLALHDTSGGLEKERGLPQPTKRPCHLFGEE